MAEVDEIKQLIKDKDWWREQTRNDWFSFEIPDKLVGKFSDDEVREILREWEDARKDGKTAHAKITRSEWADKWDTHFFGYDEETRKKRKKNYNSSSGGKSSELDKFMEENKLVWIPFVEFDFGDQIGEGGFAYVNKAKLKGVEMEVALKRLKYEDMNEFLKEWRTHARFIYSREIVNVIGFTQNPDGKFLAVMAYANRGTLRSNLKKIYLSGWKQKLYILYKIASGLREIHLHKYAHLDIHDGNILINKVNDDGNEFTIDAGDDVWICDLGICETIESLHEGDIFGQAVFMAPEATKGKRSESSDIYSFSMIMWELTSGVRPFNEVSGSQEIDLMLDVREKNKRPAIAEDTPLGYQSLMKKCWDQDPKNRPTAEQVLIHIMELIFESEDPSILKEIKEFIVADGKSRVAPADSPPPPSKSRLFSPVKSEDSYGKLGYEYKSTELDFDIK